MKISSEGVEDKFLRDLKCNFERISDAIRKRLATQQKLKGLNYIEMFHKPDILKPFDREFLMLLSAT